MLVVHYCDDQLSGCFLGVSDQLSRVPSFVVLVPLPVRKLTASVTTSEKVKLTGDVSVSVAAVDYYELSYLKFFTIREKFLRTMKRS